MIRYSFITICLLITVLTSAQLPVRIEIKQLPSQHPANSAIYLAGSFNGWNPAHPDYRFKQDGNIYSISFSLRPGNYEYKITRGGWDKVETGSAGNDVQNRTLRVDSELRLDIAVEGWKDKFAAQPKKHTAGTNVQILDSAFFIPQLNRYRKVWVYLPPGYETSRRKYPVLYMHDGQNVFDDATSFAGEWGVDECIDTMSLKTKGCIVVAIDNGGSKRLNEYSPYDFNLSGTAAGSETNIGEGEQYVDFLARTLKPYIDKHYRTNKKRKGTFIAGSSMGGLISMYALLRYPKTYGGAGVFSPAFWVAPKIFEDISNKGHKVKSRIYFYAGVPESETMAPFTLKAFEGMQKVSKSRMEAVIRAEGMHNEQRWRKEFPLFYEWILR